MSLIQNVKLMGLPGVNQQITGLALLAITKDLEVGINRKFKLTHKYLFK